MNAELPDDSLRSPKNAEEGAPQESPMVLRVDGGSMGSTLPDGARVVVAESSPNAINRGDIIALEPPSGRIVLHRYLGAFSDGRLLTQGDAIAWPDPPWPPESLRGRVIGASWGKKPWGKPRSCVQRAILLSLPSIRRQNRWSRERSGKLRRLFRSLAWRFRVVIGRFAWRNDPQINSTNAAADALNCTAELTGQNIKRIPTSPKIVPEPRFPSPDKASHSPTMNSSHNILPEPNSEVMEFQQLGNEWVLHNKSTGAVHLLNPTAGLIWKLWREGLKLEEIVDQVGREFPLISKDQLKKDVLDTTNKLTVIEQRPQK